MIAASAPSLKDLLSRKLRRVVVKRRLTPRDLKARTGLCERTIQRCLDGETANLETMDTIARALHVSLLEEELAGPLLGGLPLWQLRESDELWARQADVASLLSVSRPAVQQRVTVALRRGELLPGHVRRGVRNGDAVVRSPYTWLTQSPSGCTVLACPAALWLLLTSEGVAGQRARLALVEVSARQARMAGEFR